MFRNSCIGSLAVVDDEAICAAVRDASRGQQIPVVTLLRSIALETWSRCLPAGDVQRKAISAEKFLQKGGESNDLQEA